MNLTDIVKKSLDFQVPTNKLAEKFLNQEIAYKRYAVGKNSETLQLYQLIHLDGVIDDFSNSISNWNGIPIIKTKDLNADSLVVNCSTSISPVAVLDHLKLSNIENIIGFHELVLLSDGLLKWPKFVLTMRYEVENHLEIWQEIYDSLADDQSRDTFLDVFQYRLTADPIYHRHYKVRINEQYFEDFMEYSNEVFVDAGGFDGDTSEIFAERYPDYRKILFFEPSLKNMAAAQKRLSIYDRIEFYDIGLSNAKGVLKFNQDAGSASSVNESVKDTICVEKLDDIISEPVTFIKMDLEGWELHALKGANNCILSDHPKLALAVYHDSKDFRLIYEYIKSLGLKYKIYLRHYMQGWSETIMYFQPIKNF